MNPAPTPTRLTPHRPHPGRWTTCLAATVTALALTACTAGCAPSAPTTPAGPPGSAPAARPHWTQTWGAAVQPPVDGDEDEPANWSKSGFRNHSVRQVVRVTASGSQVRLRLSNRYGTGPLKVDGAALARSAGGGVAWPGTTRRLTFGHTGTTVIPAGQETTSDPLPLATSPLEDLVITLRFAGRTGPATFHRVGLATSYRAAGDHLDDVLATAYTQSSRATYYLSGVDVLDSAGPARSTVVAFGDSLTDGVGTTPDAHNRYLDDLAERLIAARRDRSVVNRGIAGNMLLTDSPCFGEKGTTRFRREVLDRPDVRTAILELGGNDIGVNWSRNPCLPPTRHPVTARQIADGYTSLVRAAHQHGIKVVGTTVIPLRGYPGYSARAERLRTEVNHWIRTSGTFDTVVDLDRALADPAHPDHPRPGYVFMDGLHPDDAGSHALANAFGLDAL
ncbi:SGNH/GDSL hydrolase family protein [Streptomyces sp. NPDC058000]|uniref:SGNH/GDSL hydrolase family protein n=1 Tax=Streptomyces sp. NPDC058000 TaxID=3346299 RepID=UPI0036E6DF37